MRHTNDLGRDKIFPLVCRLAIPTMLAQMVSVLYSIVDRIYIGNIAGIGDLALAGVGVCGPIVTLLSSFASLVGLGGAPILAMRLGEGRPREAEKVVSNGFLTLLILSAVLTSVFLLLKDRLLMVFGASEATFGYADTYLTIYTCGTVFSLLATGLNSYLIAQGFSGLGMFTVVLGAVLNIVLDPIFIMPWGFNMGAAGAGLATFISNCVACCYFFVLLAVKRGKTYVCVNPRKLSFDGRIVRSVCGVGVPAAIQNLLNVTGMTILNNFTSAYGADAIAAMGICQKLAQVPMYASMGFSQGVMPLVSYNYSSGNIKRMKGGIRLALTVSLSFMDGAGYRGVRAFPRDLCAAFHGHSGRGRIRRAFPGGTYTCPAVYVHRLHGSRRVPGRRSGAQQPYLRHTAQDRV